MHFSTLHLAAFALTTLSPIAVRAGNTYFTMTTPKILDYADTIKLTWEAESSTETYELGLAQGSANDLSPYTIINGEPALCLVPATRFNHLLVFFMNFDTKIQAATILTRPFILPGGYEPGTSYSWSALDIIPAGTYAFYIQQKSNGAINYSPFFCLQACSSSTSAATFASSTPSSASHKPSSVSKTPSSAASIAATVTAASTSAAYASGNVNKTVQYYNASGYGSTVEGSGNVEEFTGGAVKAGMMGVGAMVAVAVVGIAMMMA